MDFEEQFPGLKNKMFCCTGDIPHAIDIEDVQEFCFDKQKVREAIEKFRDSCFYLNNGVYMPSFNEDCLQYQEKLVELFKELGL